MHWRHGLNVFARTAAHTRLVYGLGRSLADWRNRRLWNSQHSQARKSTAAPGVEVDARLSPEWTEPMTALERKLVKANLADMAETKSLRRRQAAEYYRWLEPLGVIRGFDGESLPESHFPIRVPATARNDLRQYLAGHGIDTATYFPFPRGLTPAQYPHAAQAADEVILLPLGGCIHVNEVESVARHVTEGVRLIRN